LKEWVKDKAEINTKFAFNKDPAECWDVYKEGQVIASDRVQKQTAEIATLSTESVWETLAQRSKIARKWALFKGLMGEHGTQTGRGLSWSDTDQVIPVGGRR
jgi:hypothetical protein